MAAVTTALAAGTALAGMGMNIGQAVKANKQAKAAAGAADAAAKQIANIKEQNAFNRVQVPTLGFDRVREGLDRTTTAALGAAQGAGAEGVIGAASNIVQAQKDQELALAAQAGEMGMQRDLYEASAQSDINARQGIREFELGSMKLQGAQQAKADAETRKAEAIAGAIGSAGSALGFGAEMIDLYGSKRSNSGAGKPGSFKGTTVQTQQEYLNQLELDRLDQFKNQGMNLLGIK